RFRQALLFQIIGARLLSIITTFDVTSLGGGFFRRPKARSIFPLDKNDWLSASTVDPKNVLLKNVHCLLNSEVRRQHSYAIIQSPECRIRALYIRIQALEQFDQQAAIVARKGKDQIKRFDRRALVVASDLPGLFD